MPTVSERAFHRLRLAQIELVCVLSETRSLRMASERLHVSAPALSKSLREVERLAGAALFTRSAQGLAVTPAGEAFARHAHGILQRVAGLRESGREGATRPRRAMLRLGTAPFVAWKLIPPALAALAKRGFTPGIQLVEGRIVPLAEQLVHGELDAILTLFTPEALEVFEAGALVLEQIRMEKLLVVTGPQDRSAARRTTWARLASRDWILPPATYSARIQVQRAFLEAGLVPPVPVVESINIPAMLALARQGLGVTPAFASTVRDDLDAGNLRRLRMAEELPGIPIGLAYRKSMGDLAAIHALRDSLRQAA
jgi:DNA-binding transcriptional LysR family regulator